MRAMNRSAFALRETSRRLLSLGVVSLALASPWALAREGGENRRPELAQARPRREGDARRRQGPE